MINTHVHPYDSVIYEGQKHEDAQAHTRQRPCDMGMAMADSPEHGLVMTVALKVTQ